MEQSWGGDFVDRRSEIVCAESLLVSRAVCEKLHEPECPLDLSPLCPACTGRYTMGSLHIGGCHPLTEEEIDAEVTRTSPGTYRLGYLDGGAFIVFYVGRSDSDLNDRLHSWVGVDSRSTRYCPSARAAYGSRRRSSLPLGTPAPRPVGVAVDGRYTHFEFIYAPTAMAAFEKDCRNYHDFGGSHGLDNERHPMATAGCSWTCPVHGHHQR